MYSSLKESNLIRDSFAQTCSVKKKSVAALIFYPCLESTYS